MLGDPTSIYQVLMNLCSNSVHAMEGGTGTLKVDGRVVATAKMEKTIPMLLQWCESFDVGADTGSPVDDEDYQCPFRFTGKLDKLTLTIDRPKLSPEDIERLERAMHSNPASE